MTAPKQRVGRPSGSGAQLPAVERMRKSRSDRAKAGAVRLDFSLVGESAQHLATLMQQWASPTRKDAVERALSLVCQTIHHKRGHEK